MAPLCRLAGARTQLLNLLLCALVVQAYCGGGLFGPRGARRTLRSTFADSCPNGTPAQQFICNCEAGGRDKVMGIEQILLNTNDVSCEPVCSEQANPCNQPDCPEGLLTTCFYDGCATTVPVDKVEVIRSGNCKFSEVMQLYACSPEDSVDIPTFNAVNKGYCVPVCKAADTRCSFQARFGDSPASFGITIEPVSTGAMSPGAAPGPEADDTDASAGLDVDEGLKDEACEVRCQWKRCVARMSEDVYDAIKSRTCTFSEVNQMYNCGSLIAVDQPGWLFATKGICTTMCGDDRFPDEFPCVFRPRTSDSVISPEEDPGEIALPPDVGASGP